LSCHSMLFLIDILCVTNYPYMGRVRIAEKLQDMTGKMNTFYFHFPSYTI